MDAFLSDGLEGKSGCKGCMHKEVEWLHWGKGGQGPLMAHLDKIMKGWRQALCPCGIWCNDACTSHGHGRNAMVGAKHGWPRSPHNLSSIIGGDPCQVRGWGRGGVLFGGTKLA